MIFPSKSEMLSTLGITVLAIVIALVFGGMDSEVEAAENGSNDDVGRIARAEERQAKALEQILVELRKIRKGCGK